MVDGRTATRASLRLGVVALVSAVLLTAGTTDDRELEETGPLRTGTPEIDALADEAGRDTGPAAVPLPQVASGAREDVPSALYDADASGLPSPSIDVTRLVAGGPPPDGIPAIDQPRFQRTDDVRWVDDEEQVLVVEVDDDARAYPVQVLTLHEIVNDTVGGVPVAVTYCPLCASGLAFDRRVGDRVLSFGTSGKLLASNLVMYDRQTQSLWPQVEGQAVAGVLTGAELTRVPAAVLSWAQWRDAHPHGWVLSRQTGYGLGYGSNPYYRYDEKASAPLFYDFPIDNRIEWLKQPVLGIAVGNDALAIDLEALAPDGVREVTVGGREITVWWVGGARSSLDGFAVGTGREVGSVGVFEPFLYGRRLTFRTDGTQGIVDVETGSRWNLLGQAVAGPAAGSRLEPVPHVTTFWFAWRAAHERTRVLR
jgi:hypothetical protein